MTKEAVIKADQSFVLKIVNELRYNEFTRQTDGSKGSVQILNVKLESGNKTQLKIWDREQLDITQGFLVKVLHADQVKENWEGVDYVNIWTTKQSEILFPYNPQTKLQRFTNTNKNKPKEENKELNLTKIDSNTHEHPGSDNHNLKVLIESITNLDINMSKLVQQLELDMFKISKELNKQTTFINQKLDNLLELFGNIDNKLPKFFTKTKK